MTRISFVTLAGAALTLSLMPSVSSAQRLTGPHPSGEVPSPVVLDPKDQFQDKFAKVGDDVFISGQPTEQALRDLAAQGVKTVVNLRTPPEMATRVPFDEKALVQQLGMKYVYLPMRGNEEYPYSPDDLRDFGKAMKETKGKLLLHCTVAWRASHMWAAYLIQFRDLPVATALDQARKINLMDDMRSEGERQPVEDLLGRSLSEIKHGKQ
ncbi:MAG: fused DSP-PTPase phosphatase/NAD kinase-like protein [Gemmatimonadaceae bacterium]